MITVRITIEPVDAGFSVRIGPDVLDVFPTETAARAAAEERAEFIRQGAGEVTVVSRPVAAAQSGPHDEAGFPDELSSPG